MKKSATETGPRPPAEEKTENRQVLRLKKRPLVSLTDAQMGDAAGGHNTCDPTCPPTCCPTCRDTCRGCPVQTDNDPTCGDTLCDTCDYTCPETCDTCGMYDC